jgi:hypothetical protein
VPDAAGAADAVARAFGSALRDAVAAVPGLVLAAAQERNAPTAARAAAPPAPEAPEPIALVVEPLFEHGIRPPGDAPPLDAGVRLLQIDASGVLGALDVVAVKDGAIAASVSGMRWHRRPQDAAAAALAAAVEGSGSFLRGVVDSSSASTPAFELRGTLSAFHLLESGDATEAVVAMELELKRRGAPDTRRLPVEGRVPLRTRAPEDVAAAMSAALGRAVETAAAGLRVAARDLSKEPPGSR